MEQDKKICTECGYTDTDESFFYEFRENDYCSLHYQEVLKTKISHAYYHGHTGFMANALKEIVRESKPRGVTSELERFYIEGWNKAMRKVVRIIEKELQ